MPKATNLNAGWREEAMNARKLHHIAMMHGAHAGKKTLRSAVKSSLEELSAIAPRIFPPDRVVKLSAKKKRVQDAAA